MSGSVMALRVFSDAELQDIHERAVAEWRARGENGGDYLVQVSLLVLLSLVTELQEQRAGRWSYARIWPLDHAASASVFAEEQAEGSKE